MRLSAVGEGAKVCKNKIIINGEVAYIVLLDGRGNETGRAIIDTADIPRVEDYKWRLKTKGDSGYAVTGRSPKIYLHRLIHGSLCGELTDHCNQNKLDCRKSNLRTCTASSNMANRKRRKDNASGYKGVYYHKQSRKWAASMSQNNKSRHLGLFGTKEEAARAYNAAALEYHNEFACLNTFS